MEMVLPDALKEELELIDRGIALLTCQLTNPEVALRQYDSRNDKTPEEMLADLNQEINRLRKELGQDDAIEPTPTEKPHCSEGAPALAV